MDDNSDAALLTLQELSVEELLQIASRQSSTSGWEPEQPFQLWYGIDIHKSVEEIGAQMDDPPGVSFYSAPQYWDQFKKEFRLFLCAKDRKYSALRKELSQVGGRSQLVIVSTIAAGIAKSFGVAAGSLVPACAICLIAVIRMGKEAFCMAHRLDVPIASTHVSESRK
jgi:hypothetical protein